MLFRSECKEIQEYIFIALGASIRYILIIGIEIEYEIIEEINNRYHMKALSPLMTRSTAGNIKGNISRFSRVIP